MNFYEIFAKCFEKHKVLEYRALSFFSFTCYAFVFICKGYYSTPYPESLR